jgi:type I restriction enzyme S subunit
MITDSKFIVPEGWFEAKLGEIILLEYGKNLTGTSRRGTKYLVWGSNGIIGKNDQFLVEGPVIIIGRKGSVGNVNYCLEDCWPIDTTYYVKPTKSLNFLFAYYLLKSLNLEKLDKSTTIPGLNRKSIYDVSISIPSELEQEKIVEKIEELLSGINSSTDSLEKVKKQLAVYRQVMLKDAFEGKLTSEWRKINEPSTGIQLLKNLRVEKQKFYESKFKDWETKKGTKPKKNDVLQTEPDFKLPPIPKEWKWIKFSEFEDYFGSGSTPLGGKNSYVEKGIPLIRSQNVHANKLALDNVVYIDTDLHEKMKRSQLKARDVLLNITGASIGRSTFIPEEFKIGNVNQHVCILRTFSKKINYKFLSTFLNSPIAQILIREINAGATREALNFEQIRNLPFPLFSLEEQNEIMDILETNLSIIEKLEVIVNSELSRLSVLSKSILKKAFQGKLVTPIDSIEYSDLIEKIRIEKANYQEELIVKNKVKPKTNVNMSNESTIIEVLSTNTESMPAKEVWAQSKHNENIEEFYTELKKIYSQIEETEKGYIKLKDENR